MVKINWFVCKDVGWCDLYKIDINNKSVLNTYCIYIAWKGSGVDSSRTVLKIGQGFVQEVIINLRDDSEISSENKHGIFFTWAKLPNYHLNGVEVYLNHLLKPKFKSNDMPDESSKVAELPWSDGEDSLSFEKLDYEDNSKKNNSMELPF